MRARVALALLVAGCAEEPVPQPPPVGAITTVSFNVHGSDRIRDPVAGPNMAAQIEAAMPDFVALQECVDCPDLIALLPSSYQLGSSHEPVTVAYDSSRWDPVDDGVIVLGSNDDGWGERTAAWVRFRERATDGVVDVYSTHWCVTIRRPDDACDVERHIRYGDKILASNDARRAAAIIGGDFNVFDDFEHGDAVEHLVDGGLVDTLRAVTDDPVVTFHGNTWAPAGRIDYVFASSGAVTLDAWVDESLTTDEGSDHNPVGAVLTF